jgi:hypothetical protein
MKGMILCIGTPKNHDPRGLIIEHFKILKIISTFQHNPNGEDILF